LLQHFSKLFAVVAELTFRRLPIAQLELRAVDHGIRAIPLIDHRWQPGGRELRMLNERPRVEFASAAQAVRGAAERVDPAAV
jgi:hypothetical protein